MSFNCGTNVWGNVYRENREKSRAKLEARNNFGENSGPQSLPAFNTFQNKTNSLSNKISSTSSNIKSSSGSLSKTSSPLGSNSELDKRLDWGRMVDNVFREEIRKMAEGY